MESTAELCVSLKVLVREGHGGALGPWALWSDELGANLSLLTCLPAVCPWVRCVPSLSLPSSLGRWRNSFSGWEDGEVLCIHTMLGITVSGWGWGWGPHKQKESEGWGEDGEATKALTDGNDFN